MAYYPLHERISRYDASLELQAVFYEILSEDIAYAPEFWDYRTALYRLKRELERTS
jgi:hypothetical protein